MGTNIGLGRLKQLMDPDLHKVEVEVADGDRHWVGEG